jgi:hypothetical protein
VSALCFASLSVSRSVAPRIPLLESTSVFLVLADSSGCDQTSTSILNPSTFASSRFHNDSPSRYIQNQPPHQARKHAARSSRYPDHRGLGAERPTHPRLPPVDTPIVRHNPKELSRGGRRGEDILRMRRQRNLNLSQSLTTSCFLGQLSSFPAFFPFSFLSLFSLRAKACVESSRSVCISGGRQLAFLCSERRPGFVANLNDLR